MAEGKLILESTQQKNDRSAHSGNLGSTAADMSKAWKIRVETREQNGLPTLPKSIPLILEVDTSLDLDELRRLFGFEIVSEHEGGYVIIASEDLDLNVFLQKLKDFIGTIDGSATVAQIHNLENDPDQLKRLSHILSEEIHNKWDQLDDDDDYIVDVGVACSGGIQIPSKPKEIKRNPRWKDSTWARKQAEFADTMKKWSDDRNAAYMAWQDLADARSQEIVETVCVLLRRDTWPIG